MTIYLLELNLITYVLSYTDKECVEVKSAIEHIAQEYETCDGWHPFADWVKTLKGRAAVKITKGVAQLRAGNFSNSKVGQGVSEHKIDFGSGYRIYYAIGGDMLIILFCGGDKSTQQKDIDRAHKYYADYKNRSKTESASTTTSGK